VGSQLIERGSSGATRCHSMQLFSAGEMRSQLAELASWAKSGANDL